MQPSTDPHSPNFLHQPLVEVQNLCVQYGNSIALDNISLHLCASEFVAVIGPNGAGKSTLLKSILGLVTTSAGNITFTKNLGTSKEHALAYLPQQRSLDWNFPITVRDLVMMGRIKHIGFLKQPKQQDHHIVEKALHDTDMQAQANKQIAELSGGQKQRVLLARMLAHEAKLMLLDEPLTGVDAISQTKIFEILERERKLGKAILMVTHDLHAAREYCTNMILLNRRMVATGKSEHVDTPENIAATFARAATE